MVMTCLNFAVIQDRGGNPRRINQKARQGMMPKKDAVCMTKMKIFCLMTVLKGTTPSKAQICNRLLSRKGQLSGKQEKVTGGSTLMG